MYDAYDKNDSDRLIDDKLNELAILNQNLHY